MKDKASQLKNDNPAQKTVELWDELCTYCPLDDRYKGVYITPGGCLAGCEGSHCDEAYEIYLEEADHEDNLCKRKRST